MWNAKTVKELFEQLNNTWMDRTGEALNVEYKECYGNFLYWNIWNVIMFMPIGALALPAFGWKIRFWQMLIGAVALSMTIELLQLIFKLGAFEPFDDVFHNTLGALAGFFLAVLFRKIFLKKSA